MDRWPRRCARPTPGWALRSSSPPPSSDRSCTAAQSPPTRPSRSTSGTWPTWHGAGGSSAGSWAARSRPSTGQPEDSMGPSRSSWTWRRAGGRAGEVLPSGAGPGTTRFFREMSQSFSEQGRLMLLSLQSGTRVLAQSTALLAGPGLFGFKKAYDEAYARWSPGTLLDLDVLSWFHDTPPLGWLDTCSATDVPLFSDRRAIRTLLLPLSPAGTMPLGCWRPRCALAGTSAAGETGGAHEGRLRRWRARRPLLLHPHETARPGPRPHRPGAQSGWADLRLGRGVLGRPAGRRAPQRPGDRMRHGAALVPLGRPSSSRWRAATPSPWGAAGTAWAARRCST